MKVGVRVRTVCIFPDNVGNWVVELSFPDATAPPSPKCLIPTHRSGQTKCHQVISSNPADGMSSFIEIWIQVAGKLPLLLAFVLVVSLLYLYVFVRSPPVSWPWDDEGWYKVPHVIDGWVVELDHFQQI